MSADVVYHDDLCNALFTEIRDLSGVRTELSFERTHVFGSIDVREEQRIHTMMPL